MNLDVKKAKMEFEKSGLTPTQFSKLFGIHRSYVYNTFSVAAVPGRKFFAAWAKFCAEFELNFFDFFVFDNPDDQE